MNYKLSFTESAKKEYDKLDANTRTQFKKKLEKILENPKIPKNKLQGSNAKNLYKIKLRAAGYRLLYEVIDDEVLVLVISIGKRDSIYKTINNKGIS